MIMKKILSLILLACFAVSCSDFLDTENLTKKDSQSFPKKPSDAEQVLTSVYHELLVRDQPLQSIFMVSEVMSDDRFGAGGSDDRMMQACARYMKNSENMYADAWSQGYRAIYRCNFLLASIEQVAWENDAQKNRVKGEALFMRAYFYFNLARMFGNIPLITEPSPQNNPQAAPEEVYGQMASDLKEAIALLPSTTYQDMDKLTLGHATKWAAEGLMARVFLFYTGYYQKPALPLAAKETGEVSKNEVIGWIDDCVLHSGHDLLKDFRNLWPYSFCKDYVYTKDNSLKWIGEEGANVEAVFSIRHSGNSWEGRNLDALCFGLRYQNNYEDCFPFGQGWGFGTVNPVTKDNWPDNDLRKKASILNVDDPSEGMAAYTDNGENQVEDTHLFNKKYIPVNVKKLDGSGIESMWAQLYDLNFDFQSCNIQDIMVIRFADILLMGAELGGPNAQSYLDRVRNRVGLASVPATLENIKNERHWELAFEGVRYYDLLRWHDEDLLTKNRTNITVRSLGVETKISIPFRKETGGFLQIPTSQIDLSGKVLKQNPGWEGSESMY